MSEGSNVSASTSVRLRSIEPPEIRIDGTQRLSRIVHQDSRGFLVETLRADDPGVEGSRFRMSYTSFTNPGQYRDIDRWHVHRVQSDRFICLLGEMTLALLDGRKGSRTEGLLDVVRLSGVSAAHPTSPSARNFTTYLIQVPPGVLHSLGNLSSEPFLYQNYPTELYNPSDEGRVPFSSLSVEGLGRQFSWDLLTRTSES